MKREMNGVLENIVRQGLRDDWVKQFAGVIEGYGALGLGKDIMWEVLTPYLRKIYETFGDLSGQEGSIEYFQLLLGKLKRVGGAPKCQPCSTNEVYKPPKKKSIRKKKRKTNKKSKKKIIKKSPKYSKRKSIKKKSFKKSSKRNTLKKSSKRKSIKKKKK